MSGSILIIVLTTVLFLTGLLQLFLQGKEGKGVTIWKIVLVACMVLAFLGTLVQNLQNDRDNSDLRDKANKTLGLMNENKDIARQLVELNKTIVKKNEQIVELSKKTSLQSEEIAEMHKLSTGGDGYCFLLPMLDANRQKFILNRVGKYPIYNVEVVITDEMKVKDLPFDEITKPLSELIARKAPKEEWDKLYRERDFFAEFSSLRSKAQTKIDVPVLLPGRAVIITLPYVVPEKAEELKYSIDIYSLNGNVRQIVRYLLKDGKWKMSFRAMKNEGGHDTKILQEGGDRDVPL